jgi:hypothetical protein
MLASGASRKLRAAAVATVAPGAVVRLPGGGTTMLPRGTGALIPRRAVARFALPPWPAQVTLAADASATLRTGAATARAETQQAATLLAQADKAPAALVDVPSGADVVLPGGGTVTGAGAGQPGAITVKQGQTLHIPPQARISVLAGAVMTVPGTGDITVNTASTLLIGRFGTGGAGGSLTIPSDSIDPGQGKAADATFAYPARIEAATGAKVTVVGVADITLPAGTKSKASYRAEADLRADRGLQVPTGANVLFGNLRMIIAVAAVTMFGIGAEIGIAGVLAYGLSEASQPWRVGMLAVIGLVALLTIAYAVTAIRAIADPRPGSSISATSGTSFTL